jgi:hypothetical protein
MMSDLQFPLNPTNGQVYSIGSMTWTWNGFAWQKISNGNQGGGGGGVSVVTPTGTTSSGLIEYGTDISFIFNPTTGAVSISDTSTLQTVTDRNPTTNNVVFFDNTSASTSSVSGAIIIAGGVGIGGDAYLDGQLNAKSLKISESIIDSVSVSINTTATTIVDSYSTLQFRSAKYLIQIDEGEGPAADFEVIEILLLVDNSGTVYATEYGLLTSNGDMGEFAADVQGDNILRLYFTPFYSTSKVLKILRTGITV